MDRTARHRKPQRPPLDEAGLRDLALGYVARYATSSGKLAAYLRRKLAERGWGGDGEAPVAGLVEQCVAARWIDDAAYADGRVAALARAGYGARRRDLALRAAGLDAEQRESAERRLTAEDARDVAWTSALACARRRRIGPYAGAAADRDGQRKAIAALVRAGHDYDIARRIASLPPGADGEAAGRD